MQRDNKMKPLARVYPANTNMTAAQNFLANQRNLYRMIDVVICRVAGRNVLKCKPGNKTDDTG
jgi:hypothetical protein